MDVIDHKPKLERIGAHVKRLMRDQRFERKQYICKRGDDMPKVDLAELNRYERPRP